MQALLDLLCQLLICNAPVCLHHINQWWPTVLHACSAALQQQHSCTESTFAQRTHGLTYILTQLMHRRPGRQSHLRRTFDEIDAGGKGFVEAGDLQAYANKHGLPAAYVPAFMAAVAGSAGPATAASGGAPSAEGIQQRIP